MQARTLDEDEIYCPLSKCVMHHPVYASDGHYYELGMLLEFIKRFGKISPLTRQPLTSVRYASGLKKILEEGDYPQGDRYEEYDKEPLLTELQNYFPKSSSESTCRSVATAAAIAFMYAAFCYLQKMYDDDDQNNINVTTLCQLFVVSAFIDFGFRLASGHRFGLFEIGQNTLQEICTGRSNPNMSRVAEHGAVFTQYYQSM